MTARRLFITGTDTGVGKTRVGAAIVAAWSRSGRRVAAMKPIETGCARIGHELVGDDGAVLHRAAGGQLDRRLVAPIRFATPTSPAAAAAHEALPIDLAEIDGAAATLAADSDVLVIEGAGGLLVPITDRFFMADLALRLAARLLIVARTSIGTVNHTLLTVEAARSRGIHVVGLVMNCAHSEPRPEDVINSNKISELCGIRLIGSMPFGAGDPQLRELADVAERHLDLDALWNSL